MGRGEGGRRWHRRLVAGGLAAALVAVGLADRENVAESVTLAPAARPGPAVLWEAEASAPMLENRSGWFQAAPTLVSGTETYDRGEYLYQDHLYDDYGADTGAVDPGGVASVGDIDYPTDRARYGGNAADLVEFRIAARSADDAVAYRFTFNTLLSSDSTIATVAYDTDGDPSTGAERLPRDPGAAFPGTDEVITVWGTGGEHTRFPGARAAPVTTPLVVTTDLEANQITVVVPRTVSDPQGTWSATVATGLYDGRTGGWLIPQPGGPSATSPSGATAGVHTPPAIFNLGLRLDEPVLTEGVPPDTAQAAALTAGQPTRFARGIDFDALAAGTERSSVPDTGPQIRIFSSHLDLGEGRDADRSPRYLGRLQPYAVTVPPSYKSGSAVPFTLLLHSFTRHHWQYLGSKGLRRLADERDSLVVTPLGRGADGWYQREAEYDVFEAWADAGRHFDLDYDRVAVAGYSMGGYGAYRLAALYPDLFGRLLTVAAPPGPLPDGGRGALTTPWLANLRHIPVLSVAGAGDRVIPLAGPEAQRAELERLGYRHRFLVVGDAGHETFPAFGYEVPTGRGFLGEAPVVRDPWRVTFVYDPAADEPRLGLIHDHAYWISALSVADHDRGPGGIDARSLAAGRTDAPSESRTGWGSTPYAWRETGRIWKSGPAAPAENRLALSLSNVASAQIDVARAGLDPGGELVLDVAADLPAALVLAGRFPPATAVRLAGDEPRSLPVQWLPGGLVVPVEVGSRRYVIDRLTENLR